jgi:hypothetical protein
MILEADDQARKRIAASLQQQARRTVRDGKPHDVTLIFGDDFAVTVHSVPPGMENELSDRLSTHGRGRAAQSGLRRWLGIGTVAVERPSLNAMAVLLVPERLDDE